MIGYSGYIAGVGPENVYAKTYSRATLDSSSNAIPRGIDQPANLKFQTSSGSEFIHHNADAHESVSQVVGVQRNQDTYKRVSRQFLSCLMQEVGFQNSNHCVTLPSFCEIYSQ